MVAVIGGGKGPRGPTKAHRGSNVGPLLFVLEVQMSKLTEVGKTISAATAATLRAALNAIQELLDVSEAEVLEGNGDLAEATKSEDGEAFPASDYAYVPDAQAPSTWKLRLTAMPGGKPDSGIVGAACAALGPGFRGQKVDIPEADLAAVKAKVRAAWRKANPDKEAADMPSGIKEAADDSDMSLAEEHIELIERAIGEDGMAHIRLMAPGWGTSGYYPPNVLQRDGPKIFHKGLHMHLDHQTEAERKAKLEGSLKDFAGVLASDAHWEADGPVGPGLYADAKVFEQYHPMLDEMAPYIGVSIRASGKAVKGEAEGRQGNIIEAITAANTTDYVTHAGAGGAILPLLESAPSDGVSFGLFEAVQSRQSETTEDDDVKEQEAEELRAENARLREALLLREARDVVAEALAKVDMPEPTRVRLIEALAKSPPIKDGALDAEAFGAKIAEMAKAELLYLAQATGRGQIRGMGASVAHGVGDNGKDALKESFKGMYLRQGNLPEEAERLAALAAGGR